MPVLAVHLPCLTCRSPARQAPAARPLAGRRYQRFVCQRECLSRPLLGSSSLSGASDAARNLSHCIVTAQQESRRRPSYAPPSAIEQKRQQPKPLPLRGRNQLRGRLTAAPRDGDGGVERDSSHAKSAVVCLKLALRENADIVHAIGSDGLAFNPLRDVGASPQNVTLVGIDDQTRCRRSLTRFIRLGSRSRASKGADNQGEGCSFN